MEGTAKQGKDIKSLKQFMREYGFTREIIADKDEFIKKLNDLIKSDNIDFNSVYPKLIGDNWDNYLDEHSNNRYNRHNILNVIFRAAFASLYPRNRSAPLSPQARFTQLYGKEKTSRRKKPSKGKSSVSSTSSSLPKILTGTEPLGINQGVQVIASSQSKERREARLDKLKAKEGKRSKRGRRRITQRGKKPIKKKSRKKNRSQSGGVLPLACVPCWAGPIAGAIGLGTAGYMVTKSSSTKSINGRRTIKRREEYKIKKNNKWILKIFEQKDNKIYLNGKEIKPRSKSEKSATIKFNEAVKKCINSGFKKC